MRVDVVFETKLLGQSQRVVIRSDHQRRRGIVAEINDHFYFFPTLRRLQSDGRIRFHRLFSRRIILILQHFIINLIAIVSSLHLIISLHF